MIDFSTLPLLKDKKALVTGVANDQSIAWGCAKAFRTFGADLALTYLNAKAKPYVEPLAKEVNASIFMPLNVQAEDQLEAVFDTIEKQWGKLDICLHSIAFAPKQDLQKAEWWIVRRRASYSPWRYPAGRSSAWRNSPSR